VDARSWRGGSGTISWGTGEYRSTVVRTVVTTVEVGRGSSPVGPPRQGQTRRFSEMIGGAAADMWDNELDGARYTGATWKSPRAIHISGESRDARSAATQLRVYRTVRFTGP
jgi:hypothetical protein